jgi:hypothetical protein
VKPLASIHVAVAALAAALATPPTQAQPHVFAWASSSDADAAPQRVVKGAPYCADAVRETVQSLSDGNRIVQRSVSRQCRDGEGRTRQEVDSGGRKRVWLHDPVAQQTWLLDPERKTARRHSAAMNGFAYGFNSAWRDGEASRVWQDDFAARMKEFQERMREWSKEMSKTMLRVERGQVVPTPPTPPTQPTPMVAPVVISDLPGAADAGERRLHVLRLGSGDLPAPSDWRLHSLAPRGAGVTTSLGSKDIEGVRANGERTSWTLEAGKVGNEKPIVITREVWSSPELMLTVLITDNDPRSSQTSYRLANLQRGEPDAALMRVPADYSSTPARSSGKP